MPDNFEVLVSMLVIGTMIATGVVVMDAIGTSTGGGQTVAVTNESVELSGSSWVAIAGGLGEQPVVYDSAGNAIELTGADDSKVQSRAEVDIATDNTWTVCTWAAVDDTSAANASNMTALSADGRVLLGYENRTGANWTLYVYDDGERASTTLTAPASNQHALHQLCGYRNGTDLRLYVNASLVNSTTISGDETARSGALNNSNWDGTLEESRTFDTALNASQRNATYQSPVKPLGNATRTARIMYDEGSGSVEPIYFSDTEATVTNATWVDGFDGHQLDRVDMLGNGDYRWDTDGPRIKPESDSYLSDAPVAFVSYQFSDITTIITKDVAGSMEFGAVLLVVLAAGLVIAGVRVLGGDI